MWLPKGQRTKLSVDRKKTSQSFFGALPPSPDQQKSQTVPDRGQPEHLADDPRPGPAPTRNRGREDRGRPGQRPLPPRESVDRPLRARPAAGAHHPCFPAAVRARPQPGRARPERGQEQHRDHPARDPRRNLRRVRLIHRQPNIRLRLRAPPTPRNQKRSCSMTAISLLSSTCPESSMHVNPPETGQGGTAAPTPLTHQLDDRLSLGLIQLGRLR